LAQWFCANISAVGDAAGGVLIIVENLAVPADRRVWPEATALHQAGYTVSVICPKGEGYDKAYEQIDGVHIYRHPRGVEGSGAVTYLLEYAVALARMKNIESMPVRHLQRENEFPSPVPA
jgi:hypothetical protein